MRSLLAVALVGLVLTACGGAAAGDAEVPAAPPASPANTAEPVGEPSPTASANPDGAIPRSDAVPSLEELLNSGLSESQAVCFRETIDPDDTGRVTSAELFGQAFAECLGAQG